MKLISNAKYGVPVEIKPKDNELTEKELVFCIDDPIEITR